MTARGGSGTLATSLRIQPVEDRRALKQFLQMPASLYADDPNWVHPLLFERLEHLDPKKNPYFEHAEVAYWLALRGEPRSGGSAPRSTGCISSATATPRGISVSRRRGRPRGLRALFEAAEAWLRARGMRRATGPFTLSINDETGLLIDGFDTPPYLMMGHVPRYYGAPGRAAGLSQGRAT